MKKPLNFAPKNDTKSESNLYTQKITENNIFSSKMGPKRDPKSFQNLLKMTSKFT